MKLSELVLFKNKLDEFLTSDIRNEANHALNKISLLVNSYPGTHTIDNLQHNIRESFNAFDREVESVKAQVKQDIEVAEKPWFQESYALYDGEKGEPADDILNNRNKHGIDHRVFKARVNKYVDWHHPAMIIRPGVDTFVDDMVGFDPLYLIDISHDYFNHTLAKFNNQYRNRLRPYVVNEESTDPILEKIPNGQFGFCLAYNYFNFRPFEILKRYLNEIYHKLKPGGTLAMTINDCDRESAVELVENYYCCYTPGYLVVELARSIGYEVEYTWNDRGPVTWIEFRKPGTLTSLRGGQSLAKMLSK